MPITTPELDSPFDVAALTRLAGALFNTLPGQAPVLPDEIPAPPPLGGVPVAPVIDGVPGALAGIAPPPGGVPLGGVGLTAPLPNALPGDVPRLGSQSGLPLAAPVQPGFSLGNIPPLSASLPQEAELHALLAQVLTRQQPAAPAFGAVPFGTVPGGIPGQLTQLAPTPGGVPVSGLGQTAPMPASLPGDVPQLAGQPRLPTAPQAQPSFSLANIPPLSASLPQEAELRALLAPPSLSGLPAQPPATPAPVFYFLEPNHTAVPVLPAGAHPAFNAEARARDFPILNERVNGKKLIWLDNAATTQKPHAVIERIKYFYEHENSNIHRAAHELAARATDAYEKSRETVARFINASSSEEIVFVRGATEGINLIAQSYGKKHLREGDEILLTHLEHHANIVPWQFVAAETGAVLRVAPVDDSGQVRLDEYDKLLNSRTKIVAFTHVSNALGTVTPAREMIALAHRRGARVLLDGAQSISHMPIDVQALDADWYVFSGHKVFGPTGIGAVFGKKAVLDDSLPWQGGGNMIRDVTFENSTFQDAPFKFEAGTGNIADAVGLGAALEYLEGVGMASVAAHEHALIAYATERLTPIPRLRIIGTAAEKAGVVSFVLDGIPPESVGKALNSEGIAVRSGHHCAQPILRRFGLEATVRPSFALYNTFAEIDALAHAVRRISTGLIR